VLLAHRVYGNAERNWRTMEFGMGPGGGDDQRTPLLAGQKDNRWVTF